MNENNPFPLSQPVTPQMPPQQPLPQAPIPPVQQPPPQQPVSSFPLGKILKIAGIVFGILIIIFIIIFFIRSRSTTNQTVTLMYWGLWEDSNVMQPVLDDFHRLHPTITVTYEKQDIRQYIDRFVTRSQNGNGPDILRVHNSWFSFLTPYLLPFSSDVISKDVFQKSFYPIAATDTIKNGAMYGIPLEIDDLALYTNTSLLQAAGESVPATWDEFSRIAKELTVKNNNTIVTAGAAMGTYDNITHAPDIVSLLFVQSGVDFANFSATSKNAGDALTFYTNFAQNPGNVWDSSLDSSLSMFARGNLAMYFGYSWDYFTIKAINPSLTFQISPVPRLVDQKNTIASYWAESVSAKTKHPKESFLFMQYLSQKDVQQKLFSEESKTRAFGEPYSNVSLADSLKGNVPVYPYVQQGSHAVSSIFADSTYGPSDTTYNSQLNVYLGNAVRSIFTGTSSDTAVQTLLQGVSQVFSKPYGAK